jgi:L-ascorbate metabolism protein UlaG (beta-lactamase superfamily)
MASDVTGLRLRWLGTAGFELWFSNTPILIDPFISRPAEARPVLGIGLEDLVARAIFVTHGHLDHALDVPQIAAWTGAPVFASMPVCEALHDLGIPARQLHPLAGGRTCRVGDVSARAIPARHVRFGAVLTLRALRRIGWQLFRLWRTFASYPQGDVLGYQFTDRGTTLVHFGSAGWYPEELEKLSADVALLPLQGHHRIHEIVADAVVRLGPRLVIPHHHDDFYPPVSEMVPIEPLTDLMSRRLPGTRVIEMRIGEMARIP